MMTQATSGRYRRAMKHFIITRSVEVLALQASPIIGSFLGGFYFQKQNLLRCALLGAGSLLLTAHVFVLNDWAGHNSDGRDPRRAGEMFFCRTQMARVALGLLLAAMALLVTVGLPIAAIGALIATLSFLYSCSPHLGKGTPLAASCNHLAGGMLHFLLGYTAFHALSFHGVACSLFFGLVFAAGHLNQEVRDYEADRINGIRTTAVAFGKPCAFFASLMLFTAAYALLTTLAVRGVLPQVLCWSGLLWVLQMAWSVQAFQRGLGSATAQWMQRRYRILFGLIGAAMLIR